MPIQDIDGLSGRDLQESQSGGESGEFGGNREQQQAREMIGGGPSAADDRAPGGSGGTGGYGTAQAGINQSGGDDRQGDGRQSRGDAFDEAQGGGRGPESISSEGDEADEDSLPDEDRAGAEFNAEPD